MHIPDGLIPFPQWIIYIAISFIALILALKWARNNLDERAIPLLAVISAGIFAIQAMNIPIPFGTSGHMMGAALVAIIFGSPWAAVLVLSIVLILQGLLFGDGGITALGVNIFNMGVVGGFVGFYSYKSLKRINGKFAVFIAAWASIFIASIAAAFELVVAGAFPIDLGLIYMGGFHAIIGLIEAAITLVVILAIQNVRPDLFSLKDKKSEVSSK
ncbi:cobalt transporter CbiM [Methanobacterium sp. ACI-7]|uniref:cobalt transporter CbiM n=1 Tax=unclassified Methanobacterium TaxID=2627676 RepID=UPI0039C0D958